MFVMGTFKEKHFDGNYCTGTVKGYMSHGANNSLLYGCCYCYKGLDSAVNVSGFCFNLICPWSLKLHDSAICLSFTICVSFHLLTMQVPSSCLTYTINFPVYPLCVSPLFFWFQAVITLVPVSYHSIFILFYEEPFLRLESQSRTRTALKRQWSGSWKQSIFQNTAVQCWTFMLAE